MKLGVPWSVKGIRPEARETAKEAARRSGVSLSEWLNDVIIHQAAQAGVDPREFSDEEDSGGDLGGVHERIDELSRRIEQVTRPVTGPAAYAPRHVRNAPAPSNIDQAVAEIAARQRMLNGGGQTHARPAMSAQPMQLQQPQVQIPVPQMPAPQLQARVPLPSQDLSGLEDQLRHITEKIETLRKPGVEEAINALRGELNDIGRNLAEAMPLSAIDAIEKQIHGLSQRIAEGRQAGVDGGTLSGIEHGLAEVRDALRGLTPAESLVGFNEAVDTLARKIDLIVAAKDPDTLHEFENAVTTLRSLSGHIASNETMGQLAAEVQRLADRVEQIAAANGSDALGHLEQRITAISDAIEQRAQQGGAVPPRLENLVNSLSDKIEQIQLSRGDGVALGHLEDRIVQLVEKLDVSDSRLGHLEAIERGLADLLVNVEDMRAAKGTGGVRAAPDVDVLKHDIARTQDAIEQVNGTLGTLAERMAMIEQNMRGGAPSAAEYGEETLRQPVGKIAARLVSDAAAAATAPAPAPTPQPAPPALPPAAAAPQPAPAPAPASAPKRQPAANRPMNPDLPPDQPLEPGSGPPKVRANAGARIAASEAALGIGAPATAAGKSSFINAARRAAHAAIADISTTRAEMQEIAEPEDRSLRGKLVKRVKSMFVAASVIAIVIGSVQMAANYFDLGVGAHKADVAQATKQESESKQEPKQDRLAAVATKLPPPMTTGIIPTVPAGTSAALINPFAIPSPLGSGPATPLDLSNPAMFSTIPTLTAPNAASTSSDITGSIGNSTPSTDAHALPIAIGPIGLRHAATSGDPTAAYEVAVRFADGHSVPTNLEAAAYWFERAASKGLAPAQFRLASQLEKGQGVKKDLAQARKLYLAAAGKGNAKAMHNLAVLYAEGVNGKPEYAAAIQWFRKAASRGIADSQFNLGVLYARGLGVEQDFAESYKWFALAANHGDKDAAKKRDDVVSHLDAKEVADAQQAIKAFVLEPQPEEAISVATPHGGWDHATTAPASRRPRPKTAGTFEVGKR